MTRLRLALLGLAAWLSVSAHAETPPLSAWIAFGSDGKAHVHAIVPEGQTCPTAHTSAGPLALSSLSAPDAAFPITTCVATVPTAAETVKIGTTTLKAPKARIDRIVILGDSGCRLKGLMAAQSCNDLTAWPFATIARSAAAQHPDLVIHVGDYHYRETACPSDEEGCAGSPWGDNWATWNADFFIPASPLLSAAPWVMARGNHEECARAGHGWTRLLSPDLTASPPCQPAHRPYAVDLGEVSLVVVDDNDASDFGVGDDVAPRLAADIAAVMPHGHPQGRQWWLLTHHPAHGVIKRTPLGAIGTNSALNDALNRVAQPQLLLSGHIHTFMVENFSDGHLPQLVVGTGGDSLEKTRFDDLSGVEVGDWTIKDGFGLPDFGFAVMERDGDGWRITGHFPDGRIARRCLFRQGRIECAH